MSAYKCCECGRIFDEPVQQYEYSEYWGVGKTTDFYVSPCCHTGFEEYEEDDNV